MQSSGGSSSQGDGSRSREPGGAATENRAELNSAGITNSRLVAPAHLPALTSLESCLRKAGAGSQPGVSCLLYSPVGPPAVVPNLPRMRSPKPWRCEGRGPLPWTLLKGRLPFRHPKGNCFWDKDDFQNTHTHRRTHTPVCAAPSWFLQAVTTIQNSYLLQLKLRTIVKVTKQAVQLYHMGGLLSLRLR